MLLAKIFKFNSCSSIYYRRIVQSVTTTTNELKVELLERKQFSGSAQRDGWVWQRRAEASLRTEEVPMESRQQRQLRQQPPSSVCMSFRQRPISQIFASASQRVQLLFN